MPQFHEMWGNPVPREMHASSFEPLDLIDVQYVELMHEIILAPIHWYVLIPANYADQY